ncbi:MAG: hypothetical protein ACLU71_13600 [Blautia hansenii]
MKAVKQYEKEKKTQKEHRKVFAMLVHDGMQGIRIDIERSFGKLENIVPGNDACVMLKILQELSDVAEANWVDCGVACGMANSGSGGVLDGMEGICE